MTAPLSTLPIRPASKRNALLMGALCGAFVAIGVAMVVTGDEVGFGLLGILLFGTIGIFAVPRLWRKKVSLVLTPEGLEQHYAAGNSLIPWDDIESVTVDESSGSKMVGIRLRSYDRYLESITPEVADQVKKTLPVLKVIAGVAYAAQWFNPETRLSLWSRVGDNPEFEAIREFGAVGDLAQTLAWARKQGGCEFSYTWVDLDRSPEAMVELLESYRTGGVAA